MLMLLCSLDFKKFAFPSDAISEVVPRVDISPLELKSEVCPGIIDIGGIPIPIVDFTYLILGRPSLAVMHTRIIIMKNKLQTELPKIIGVMAEKVTETAIYDIGSFIETGINSHSQNYLGPVHNDLNGMIQLVVPQGLFKILQ